MQDEVIMIDGIVIHQPDKICSIACSQPIQKTV